VNVQRDYSGVPSPKQAVQPPVAPHPAAIISAPACKILTSPAVRAYNSGYALFF